MRAFGSTCNFKVRAPLLNLLRENAARCQPEPLEVSVAALEWGKIGPINRLSKEEENSSGAS